MQKKKISVIGAGFSGLSAASFLSKFGYDVTVVERHDMPGGRARVFEEQGFKFDMGPSWYWMPDVFEQYFEKFGHKVSDLYTLDRLDPSYRVFWGQDDTTDLPANMNDFYELFESFEKGSAQKLSEFLKEAAYKYDVGINDLVYKPGLSLIEFADMRVIKGLFNLHLLQSFADYIRKYFKSPKILQLLEFPVLFLGALPQNTPALYSLMNYADISLGTWYPRGGMHEVVKAMHKVALEQGVKFQFDTKIQSLETSNKKVIGLTTDKDTIRPDIVVASADYHHVDQHLLKPEDRNYSDKYWESRKMAPSCLIYYLGLNKKIEGVLHHNLFFDEDFAKHAIEIYEKPNWPTKPLFYLSVTSKTDTTVAPEGAENVFILIPVAPGLEDTVEIRQKYYDLVMDRLEKLTRQSIKEHVVVRRDYAHNDFVKDYSAFKGNAYGLANTLMQTAILKPSLKHKKLDNLFFTGQLTVPGPGVPPSLISGEVVAKQVLKEFK